MAETVLAVEHLTKEYRTHFRRRRVRAVSDASFAVERGEIFGFVGPNGAGKTTTIRALMGLTRPTGGRCTVFGQAVPSPAAQARLGFLPESPYFYDYLTPRELLDLTGRLFGLDAPTRRRRAAELLERVGLSAAVGRPLKKFSKGMLQRAGLAQALINDPELVVLDEPMSGLDPIGRKEVRDLMVDLRDAGKTIFFSTHILHDVEAMCDRVAMIAGGRVVDVGAVGRLLDASLAGTDVVVRAPAGVAIEPLLPVGAQARRQRGDGHGQVGDDEVTIVLPPDADVSAVVVRIAAAARIVSVTPRRESLEDLFVRRAREAEPARS
jgi:ABC-2 type transport system ATP-binding protein